MEFEIASSRWIRKLDYQQGKRRYHPITNDFKKDEFKGPQPEAPALKPAKIKGALADAYILTHSRVGISFNADSGTNRWRHSHRNNWNSINWRNQYFRNNHW